MATTLVDLVKIAVTSSGAGPFHLGDAVPSYRGVEALTDGSTYSYTVQQGADYEYGKGVFDATALTLTRDVIDSSLNDFLPVPFTAGAQVGFVLLAEDVGGGGGGGAVINDNLISPNFVWSSQKTDASITASSAIVAASVSALATSTSNALATKEPTIASGLVSQFWRGDKTWVVPDKSSVGLGNVDNTSDANKPISTATQTALNGKINVGSAISLVSDPLGRQVVSEAYLGNRTRGAWVPAMLQKLSAGTIKPTVILTVGDSFGTVDYPGPAEQMANIFNGHVRNGSAKYTKSTSGSLASVAMSGSQVSGKFTAVMNFKTDYDFTWTGTNMQYNALGDYCVYAGYTNGGAIYCDHIYIPFLTQPGGPVHDVRIASGVVAPAVASGSWVTPSQSDIVTGQTLTGGLLLINTNAAAGVIWVGIKVAYGPWSAKTTTTTAGVNRVLWPFFKVEDSFAHNIYRIAAPSNNFISEKAAANPYMQALIGFMRPDCIAIGSDDDISSYTNFNPLVKTAVDGAVATLNYHPLVVLDNNPYSSTQQAAIAARTDYNLSYCDPLMGWEAVDGLGIVGGIAEATYAGIQADGIHPSIASYSMLYSVWASRIGLLASQQEYFGSAGVPNIVSALTPGAITAELGFALLGASTTNTAPMTWSLLGSSTGTITVNSTTKTFRLNTGVTASNTAVALINDATPPFLPLNGQRPLQYTGQFSFTAKLITANATGTWYFVMANDRGFAGVYKGALTGAGVGFVCNNNIVQGMCWNGTSVTLSDPFTMPVNNDVLLQGVMVRETDTTRRIYWFANQAPLGSSIYLANANALCFRFEMTNGATAADFAYTFGPPTLTTIATIP